MKWPTTEQCYAAMAKLAEYYMEGEKLDYWMDLICSGVAKDVFPPGKGFLVDIYEARMSTDKPELEDYLELHQLICSVCV
ncbi:MAG: hypothetical protein COB48_03380 [Pseudoalteromonas sp.]|uniref:hypothetical protein n=1 Tax=Pseudoalteromonas sp. MER144-MNA-CIBAN-0113 TaxID=3140429 RepID=UPI000C0FC2B8|nr:MAG: hypothetical protein COB48_03380 [Pseudoalteromonas sp.]